MLRSRYLALLTLAAFTLCAGAADKSAAPEGKELPGKVLRTIVPGYQTRLIEGFTLLISRETLENADNPAYERKPLDVLEMELKTLTRIMTSRALNVLRKVPIWVD